MATKLQAQLVANPKEGERIIMRALERSGGEVKGAALDLGCTYRTLQRLITQSGLRVWLTAYRIRQNQEAPW